MAQRNRMTMKSEYQTAGCQATSRMILDMCFRDDWECRLLLTHLQINMDPPSHCIVGESGLPQGHFQDPCQSAGRS